MAFIAPITLSGTHVQLEPLEAAHHHALVVAASDGALWKLWFTSVPQPDKMAAYIDTALAMRRDSEAMPFVIRDARDGTIVGATRFQPVDTVNRRVEIGHTWLAASAQRSGINTECKLLMLTHAFEALDCIAVEFRTNFMNHRSRAAIARLGAKQDGILRNHAIVPDGGIRDTVVFSIIASEWPAVRRHLQFKLGR